MSVRVLIVDDQSLVRAGFRMILDAETDIEVVGEAADGLEAVIAARDTEPDVILMDVRMPERRRPRSDPAAARRQDRRRRAS